MGSSRQTGDKLSNEGLKQSCVSGFQLPGEGQVAWGS